MCNAHFFFLLSFLTPASRSLRLISIDVPPTVLENDSCWLNCTLDLESDQLYSIKWYKNDEEFYRYLPGDKPPVQFYPVPGITLDRHRSNQGHVYLTKTDFVTEGMYRCEASAEAPSFQTVSAKKELRVYVLPKEGPKIEGSRLRYDVGDRINVTCISGASRPAASLKWLINNQEAPLQYLHHYPPIVEERGLRVSRLGLIFEVLSSHFVDGSLNLLCTAVLSQAYATSSQELITGDNLLQQQHRLSSSVQRTITGGPVITGGQAKYRIGDVLDVNCTSIKSKPAAYLRWYINDDEADPAYLIHRDQQRYEDDMRRSRLGLRFQVQQQHFDEAGELRLKCTSTLAKVINMRSEKRVVGNHQRSSGLHALEKMDTVVVEIGSSSSTRGSPLEEIFYIISAFIAYWL